MRKKTTRSKYNVLMIVLLIIVIFLSYIVIKIFQSFSDDKEKWVYSDFYDAYEEINVFAKDNNISMEEYPEELVDLLKKNPETREFVLNYPLKKNCVAEISIDEYRDFKEVPLLMQWDERWGYSEYGDNIMGLTGCGPTCLSMVSIYLLNDITYHPRYIADFSEENGYCVSGSGSAWTLISEGGKKLGLDIEELSLDEQKVVRNLENGNPIICIMGPGDFTTTGHFIVLTDYVDGQLKINDPNSRANSEKLWNFDDVKYQIRNLWVCRR